MDNIVDNIIAIKIITAKHNGYEVDSMNRIWIYEIDELGEKQLSRALPISEYNPEEKNMFDAFSSYLMDSIKTQSVQFQNDLLNSPDALKISQWQAQGEIANSYFNNSLSAVQISDFELLSGRKHLSQDDALMIEFFLRNALFRAVQNATQRLLHGVETGIKSSKTIDDLLKIEKCSKVIDQASASFFDQKQAISSVITKEQAIICRDHINEIANGILVGFENGV